MGNFRPPQGSVLIPNRMHTFSAVVTSLRPRQWIKNLGTFTPLFFSGNLFNPAGFYWTAVATVAFCAVASSGYLFNDVIDVRYDRTHPFKKFRAIASGAIPVPSAMALALALALTGLTAAYWVNWQVFVAALAFLIIRYTNTLVLRYVAIIDILTIAIGYVIRVYAGVAASGYYISIWLSLTVMSVSLLLAIGKHRADLTFAMKKRGKAGSFISEKVKYSEQMINTYTAMFATSTIITYSYYSFLTELAGLGFFVGRDTWYASSVFDRKWMMATIPFVIYGVMRYLQLIYEEGEGTLEKIITTDIPLMITFGGWSLVSFLVIYGIGG
ncbi:hypothetical protein A2Z33_03715 [Candidatus Gottesmanbacteria bacterium RBG_16_52_11]|uniref:Phosphoribose diphosphate--decaprenyl-phosphate phosphoribosyltransferase n=1 Tax=Candidatus Gottesmanbacteria bacterium RBG_16_52_11 TaxID=1798374 RepID=A0A1F5YVK2_9BACT|nr:MAG: hypothetical protein A2Z33_03715 [Candidatus Gottesmanbacteria bacterium RBG_16_52_11]